MSGEETEIKPISQCVDTELESFPGKWWSRQAGLSSKRQALNSQDSPLTRPDHHRAGFCHTHTKNS